MLAFGFLFFPSSTCALSFLYIRLREQKELAERERKKRDRSKQYCFIAFGEQNKKWKKFDRAQNGTENSWGNFFYFRLSSHLWKGKKVSVSLSPFRLCV